MLYSSKLHRKFVSSLYFHLIYYYRPAFVVIAFLGRAIEGVGAGFIQTSGKKQHL